MLCLPSPRGIRSQTSRLGVALLFIAGHGHLLDFIPQALQKMPSANVGIRRGQRTLIPIHMCFFRVTSHVKAMEDAVEKGLRSAFNEVGFTSFGKVLPGLKLKGEHF